MNKEQISKFEGYLNTARLKITDKVNEPPICLSIVKNGKIAIFGTLGNFSVISGKPKSRKTFFVSAIVGATLKGKMYMNIKPSFPKEKRKVIYIDTEQSPFHATRVLSRALKIAGLPIDKQPDNFQYYTIKRFSPDVRLQLIDYLINKEKNVGLVVIDGIRDVVTSINDEREATKIATHLMKWIDEQNIHIVTVLHQNKGDNNVRGHLGSELENKAESILNIKKLEKPNDDFSSVEAKNMRDVTFDNFSFGINENGILYEIENPEDGSLIKKPKFNEFSNDAYVRTVNRVFEKFPARQYKEVWREIKNTLGVGENKAKDILTFLTKEKGYIIYNEEHKNYTSGIEKELF